MDSFQLPCPSLRSGAVGSMAHTFRCLGFHSDSYPCIAGTFNSRCAILALRYRNSLLSFSVLGNTTAVNIYARLRGDVLRFRRAFTKPLLIPAVCFCVNAPYTVRQSGCALFLAASPSHSRAMFSHTSFPLLLRRAASHQKLLMPFASFGRRRFYREEKPCVRLAFTLMVE